MSEAFETVLGWADELRALGVRANADTPVDAAKAREFGAEGIGLCRTEHMFFGAERNEAIVAVILADTDEERQAGLRKLLPLQQGDFEEIFAAMAGLPVTVRLLDPPLHEFLPSLPDVEERLREAEEAKSADVETLEHDLARIRVLQEVNPMLGTRGVRLGILFPAIYEMQVEAIFAALKATRDSGLEVSAEIMVPLVDYRRELEILREQIVAIGERVGVERGRDYTVGTMIELPRACLRADEIAEEADFFSFGTNDLTQTALGFSRDDIEGRILGRYIDVKVFDRSPFETLDTPGVGQLVRMGAWLGRKTKTGPEARRLRRARGRPRLDRLLPQLGHRLRQLLPLPSPRRAGGRRPGRDPRRERHRLARATRLGVPTRHLLVLRTHRIPRSNRFFWKPLRQLRGTRTDAGGVASATGEG